MAHADLLTRCTTCREPLVIAREAAQRARPVTCSYCGTQFPLWQLMGRANQEVPEPVNELAGTWEGAAA